MILPIARGDVRQILAISLYVTTFPLGIFLSNKIALCIVQWYNITRFMRRNIAETLLGRKRSSTAQAPQSGMADFVHSLQRPQVKKALRDSLTNYTPASDVLDQFEERTLINLREISLFAPPWLDVEGLASSIIQLNSQRVWHKLLLDAEPDILAGVRGHLRTSAIRDSAKNIEGKNMFFMASVTVLSAMAAALGENIGSYTRNVFGLEIAHHVGRKFQTPAENAQELIGRLQGLFRSKNPHSLFRLLVQYNSFQIPGYRWKHCPAPALTNWIFEAYADMLENPSYQEEFVRTISKPLPSTSSDA